MRHTLFLLISMTVATAGAQTVYTLPQCRDMALRNNVKTRNARLDIDAARESEREAQAARFPSVSAGATYFHANDDLLKETFTMPEEWTAQAASLAQTYGVDASVLSMLPTEFSVGFIRHGLLANITALQPIYSGGRITAANRLARLQTEVRQIMLEQSEDDVRRTVEEHFNRLLSLYEKQATLSAALQQLKSIRRDAQNAFDAGVSDKNDVLTVDLRLNELLADSLKLDNGVRLARLLLAQYVGKYDEPFDIDRSLTTQLPPPETLLTDHLAALHNCPEYQLLEKNVEANRLQTKMKRGEQLPTVAVGAAAVYQNLTRADRTRLIGLATVSVPISAWWSNRGVKRQQIATQQAEQQRDDNAQLLLIRMQSAYNDLEAAYQQTLLARQSIAQSDENLRLNRDFYEVGMQTMTDVLDAQTKCRQSRDRLTEAVTQYLNCRTAYLLATGRAGQ